MGTSVRLGEIPWIGIWTGTLAVILAWQVWKRGRQRVLYDLHRIPGPKALPLIGNLHQVVGTDTYHKTLLRWTKQYGSVFKQRLGAVYAGAILVVVIHRKLLREGNLPKWHTGYKRSRQRAPHFSMVATPDQEDWKHVRKTTNLAFSPSTIREGFPIVYQNTLKAAEVLDELCKQGLVDVNDLAWRFTVNLVAHPYSPSSEGPAEAVHS